MIPDCTLVTACFDLSKYNASSRSFTESITNMKSLLETPCYLVIYTDPNLLDSIRQARIGLDHITRYVVQDVETLESFIFHDEVIRNRGVYHPTKDARTCAESHLVCCSKFELVLKTMESNPFNTTKFGWMDANVGVNFSKICTNYKNNMLLDILHSCSPDRFHLQILNVNDKKYTQEEHLREYYTCYRWVVCGCLFITGKDVGRKVLEDLKDTFMKHTLLGYGHGEEMFYLENLDKHFDHMERSYGDYQHILNNFLQITVGLDYVRYVANRYLYMGYHRECIDCCNKVIQQFETYKIEMNPEMYFDFLLCKLRSLRGTDATEFVGHIRKMIQHTKEYNQNKTFYEDRLNIPFE